MRRTSRMRGTFLAVAAVLVLVLAASGCGSDDKTCTDACNNLFNCATKLGVDPSTILGSDYTSLNTCISHCSAGGCPKQQQLVNCTAAVQCNNLTQVVSDATACFDAAGCTP